MQATIAKKAKHNSKAWEYEYRVIFIFFAISFDRFPQCKNLKFQQLQRKPLRAQLASVILIKRYGIFSGFEIYTPLGICRNKTVI
jgi:hypothetical protein